MVMTRKDEMVVHAKLRKEDTTPDHTLVFIKHDDKLYLGYSRPRPNTTDVFCRKYGFHAAETHSLLLLNRNEMLKGNGKTERKPVEIANSQLDKFMPKTIASVLPYYVGMAKKHFNIEGNVTIQVRGDKRNNRIFEFVM